MALVGAVVITTSGCALVDNPQPTTVDDPSLAPSGSFGYVVCTNAVTPVELASHTAEASIRLPISGTPVLGDFAIATSPDGQWAYVDTSDGVEAARRAPRPKPTAAPASTPTTTTSGEPTVPPSGVGVQNVVIPINLVTQQAEHPIKIPGQGGTHAIVVLPGGLTVLAASGSTIVPIDTVTDQVGTPLDLGPGQTVFGMVLNPTSPLLYALVSGGVFPVNTANDSAGVEIPTGLAVSSVYSPHGIVVTADGSTVYVVGQGGTDFYGEVVPISVTSGTADTPAGFGAYGISDPAAVALLPSGTGVLVVDSANNWINPVPFASFTNPPEPVRLPQRAVSPTSAGTGHPTDIVFGPGQTGAFVVDGFDTVVPYAPTSQTFGPAIPVCSGASSMAVAPAP